jgi:hypothetical protein
MKHKVLWIEDGAFTELQYMSSPIYVSGEYDLVIALDATEGYQQLIQKEKKFQTIIVDVRLPPGADEKFINIYGGKGESKIAARLGLALLQRVFNDGAKEGVPDYHLNPSLYGVFTVEGRNEFGLEDDLSKLGIYVIHQKTEGADKNKLREIIDEIKGQKNRPKKEQNMSEEG